MGMNAGSITRPEQIPKAEADGASPVSRAHQRGQIHPHRQNIIRVGVHVHSQRKLHIWRLNIVNSGAVDRLYDGPDL